MPSEHQGGSRSDRARYPDLKRDIGEDPARWLDRDLLDRPSRVVYETDDRGHVYADFVPDKDVDAAGRMVRDRIHSIDSIEVLDAWYEVEEELGKNEGKPRPKVLTWLNERRVELREIGDREDRVGDLPRMSVAERRSRAVEVATESVAEWGEHSDGKRSVNRAPTPDGGST